jgi:hypothetical protein
MVGANDMLTVRPPTFECLYALVVLGHGRRILLHIKSDGLNRRPLSAMALPSHARHWADCTTDTQKIAGMVF